MKGDFATAEAFYSKAITGFEQAGDEVRAAEATGNLGLILRRQKKFKEAKALFEKALAIWTKTERQKDIIHTLGYLGSLHFILRDFRQAIDIFTKRAELNLAKDDKAELAADYANRGNAWSKLANPNEAQKDWQQAKALYETAGKEKEAQMMAGLLAA
ncbi:MAG: tetratricopeptide repeat protein [Hyphomicrobiaceae bacterium]|nr:tetratricopeptide repeat protein [Hyphomicrobiaceae bacterium]